ncbi:BTAD domain-containing putative transcriptional regulator [Yinghuangia seranimata]|uniref:BTAD domain-containing putative transcriptional regulator n=1 Tax=Yinghuangia seranimata TaxID=408067 RepID=UPI00248B0AA0|nr:BTAD domain-containing putative transcriptional regulator [Yinghuangia seranimata]MDI2130593.1 BTAD domain-containing putative transcriptional regulator [Yinghuangia seranimata]
MLFGILGPVEAVRPDGTPVAVGGPRVRSLLALLLLDPGRIVPTETLVDGLYGEDPPGDAANALQSQVSRLRRGLRDDAGTDKLVEFHAAGYRLAVEAEQVDAHRFERLAREGRQALAAGEHADAARLLADALALWRGPAFADLTDAPFAATQAAAWEERRLDVLSDRIEADLALGRHQDLVPELHRLVGEHPLRERIVSQSMRALYGAGRQADALAVYEDTRRLLADELGTDPSAELARVHLDILRAAPSLTPAPAPAAAPQSEHRGLPAQFTSFVGRDAELARIGSLLTTARLVTLTGPGGTGKTRLSVEAGRRASGDVCFVDLAPVRRADELPQALLDALGLREGGLLPGPPGAHDDGTERLLAGLAARDVLLILDNCEQIVAEVAALVHRVLASCPGVRVMATSREALGITGESLSPVPRLPLPSADSGLDAALESPAVRLFVDRATAVRPDFTVDAATLPTVVGVCDALDGLPLAIELAAARLRALPLEQVASRLDDRFRLLSRGNRTAAPRHQTLRAVVEWSWELLDDAEQTLARRLAVFSGGASLDAVADVCGLDEDEALDLLADLADKSLVDAGNGDRYRMSETIRLYAVERLREAGEEERFRRAHVRHFLDLADRAEPRLRTGEQLEWLDRLSAEHANLRAAMRWTIDADPELGLRLAAALAWYWWLRGLRFEASPTAEELLEVFPDGAPPGLHEEFLLCALTTLSGKDPASDGYPQRLAMISSHLAALDRTPKRPQMFVMLGMAFGPQGAEDPHVWELIGEDAWSAAIVEISRAFQMLFSGQATESRGHFEAAVAGFRELGDRWGMANSIDQLAVLADFAGDLTGAMALMDEALQLMSELGTVEDIVDQLVRRADAHLRMGNPAAARVDYTSAVESSQRIGNPHTLAAARCGLGVLARHEGRYAEARRIQEQALASCPRHSFGSDDTVAYILSELAWTALAEGDTHKARGLAHAAVELTYGHYNLLTSALGMESLSGVALQEDDPAKAAALLGLAVAVRGGAVTAQPDIARVTAAAREALGDEAFDAAYAHGAGLGQDEVPAFLGTAREA